MARKNKKLITNNIKPIYLLVLILVVFGLGGYFLGKGFFNKKQVQGSDIMKVSYDCSGGKSIVAEYSGNIVSLDLSNGRVVVLDRVAPFPGTKYSNPAGSFSFETFGRGAKITEGKTVTFENCTEK